jgi:hypothetical protein
MLAPSTAQHRRTIHLGQRMSIHFSHKATTYRGPVNMGSLQVHRRKRISSTDFVAYLPGTPPSEQDEVEETASRYEPQSFTPRVCPPDPYTAWLVQREDREREELPPVRWIHRHRGAGGPAEGQAPTALTGS